MNAKTYVENLQKSQLLEPEAVREAMLACREANGGEPLSDANEVGLFLIGRGLITKWHHDKLLSGKYRGFFLGKYKLLGHIGTGGMSSVYLAEHMLMRQERAIKVLPRKRHDDKAYLDRFYLEARATAALRHPNIVQAYDVDCEGETHFIVMEYVNGKDLNETVKAIGPLPFEHAANYTAQAALGLQHAHEKGLVHRDIKPGNLLVDSENVVKILDMGLALFSQDQESLTIANDEKVLGTADFLAPEQALNSHDVDSRADIYGLGCSMYFMITGHAPFPEGSIAQRIAAHQSRMPDSIRVSRPECPGDLIEICTKMLQKKADDRYQLATDVVEVLDRWLINHGYPKVTSADARRPSLLKVRSGEGGGRDDAASSSARLLQGVSESKKVGKDDEGKASDQGDQGDKEELPTETPSGNTDPVHDSLAETLAGLDSLREEDTPTSTPNDAPVGLPKIDPLAAQKRREAKATGSSSNVHAGSPAKKGSSASNVLSRQPQPVRNDIELDGLAELEANSGPFAGQAGAAGSLPANSVMSRHARRNTKSIPLWLWITLGVGGGLIVLLTIILVIAGASSGASDEDDETPKRRSTAMGLPNDAESAITYLGDVTKIRRQ